MSIILQVHHLNKMYQKRRAVDEVSFTILSGEAYGLLGPNGAGKSTIINIVAGILEANSGEVIIGDYSITKERKKAQSLIGVVPQEIALYTTMSAEANLRFFGRLYGLKGQQLEKQVEENLQLVGLYERRKEAIDKYSGGMKRRMNIAAALLHNPKLLIMDEPTVGIDPQSRSHILSTIKKLQKEKGMSILYTSHYMDEVEIICDRIGIIDQGQLITEGTMAELKEKHGNQTRLMLSTKSPNLVRNQLSSLEEKLDVAIDENQDDFVIVTKRPHQLLPNVMNAFNEIGCEIKSIHILEPNLETIFLSLTGRNLRDE